MSIWNKDGIPHKGWSWESVIDLCEDGDDNRTNCEMCGTIIRYEHHLTHPEYDGELKVGCICAGKMTNDYNTPNKHEQLLKDKLKRQKKFLQKGWRRNLKGNICKSFQGIRIVVYSSTDVQGYRVCIGGNFGRRIIFKSEADAKKAAYLGMCKLYRNFEERI